MAFILQQFWKKISSTVPSGGRCGGRGGGDICFLQMQKRPPQVVICMNLTTYSIFSVLEEITAAFRRFGPLVVDWPHKAESKSYFPPKGNISILVRFLLVVCHSDCAHLVLNSAVLESSVATLTSFVFQYKLEENYFILEDWYKLYLS